MKKKELKDLAKHIAKAELVLQSNADPITRKNAMNEIMALSDQVPYDDMMIVDEMVQKIIKKVLDK
jgi:hypothetical protein